MLSVIIIKTNKKIASWAIFYYKFYRYTSINGSNADEL